MAVSFPIPPKKPSFSPLWQKPSKPLDTWPPRDARTAYDVKDSDSWKSIVNTPGMGLWDEWDIIIFNFRTDVPEEVNWYMHHVMQCTESNDGKNFAFRGAGQRRLYIPPFDWIPEREFKRGSFNYRQITKTVARDLLHIIPRLKAVRHNSHVVTPFHYRELHDKIEKRVLKVRFATTGELGTGSAAEYSQDDDLLLLSRYDPGSIQAKNDLVHELTHAVFDLEERTALLLDEEIVARVQEAVYSFAVMGRQLERKLAEFRILYAGNAVSSAKYFVGHVIWTHFRHKPMIDTMVDLKQEFDNPLTGGKGVPLYDLTRSIAGDPLYNQPDGLKWNDISTGNGIPSH